jgi:hypothetical protein
MNRVKDAPADTAWGPPGRNWDETELFRVRPVSEFPL